MFHERAQSDAALFNRLFPKDKSGKRSFSIVQRRRLVKLGKQARAMNDAALVLMHAFLAVFRVVELQAFRVIDVCLIRRLGPFD
jgi:hypothetical protein